jgi:hypothetical protein
MGEIFGSLEILMGSFRTTILMAIVGILLVLKFKFGFIFSIILGVFNKMGTVVKAPFKMTRWVYRKASGLFRRTPAVPPAAAAAAAAAVVPSAAAVVPSAAAAVVPSAPRVIDYSIRADDLDSPDYAGIGIPKRMLAAVPVSGPVPPPPPPPPPPRPIDEWNEEEYTDTGPPPPNGGSRKRVAKKRKMRKTKRVAVRKIKRS